MLDGTGEEKVSGIRGQGIRRKLLGDKLRHVDDALVGVRGLAGGDRAGGTAAPPKANAPSVISPNIILITLDTTRADRMGFLGSKRGLTPNLDALAHQSTVFTRAYAQAPLTTVSHATILTERIRSFIRCSTLRIAGERSAYAPDILRAHDIAPRHFSALWCWTRRGAPGFDAVDTTISFRGGNFSRAATRRAANSAPGGGREQRWWRARWRG